MKPLKPPYALLLLAGLFSIDAHALAGAISPNLDSGMRGGDNCAARSSDGGASRVDEIDCMSSPESCVHKAAWYRDRDNSMFPASPKKGVASTMAFIVTKTGYSQGIQVCPGVYLATAHGALDDPEEAKKEGRALRDPNDHMQYIDPYPRSDDEYVKIENAIFFSPRFSPSAWSDRNTDYAFIKMSNPTRQKHFIRPLVFSTCPHSRYNGPCYDRRRNFDEFITYIDVYIYRPNIHNLRADDEGNLIILDSKKDSRTIMRVKQKCKYENGYKSGLVRSDCPTEAGVSGSPNITVIDGRAFLVGIAVSGGNKLYEKFSRNVGNQVLLSSQFCDDYKLVCGRPCAELDIVTGEVWSGGRRQQTYWWDQQRKTKTVKRRSVRRRR